MPIRERGTAGQVFIVLSRYSYEGEEIGAIFLREESAAEMVQSLQEETKRRSDGLSHRWIEYTVEE